MAFKKAVALFLGHFATALMAKKLSPQSSLGSLFFASQLLDLVWPVALLLGLERARVSHEVPVFNHLDLVDAPFSHSLLMAFVWAFAFGGWLAFRHQKLRPGLVVGGVVLGHWFLDFVTHVPDLQLWFGGPKVGLGFWKYRDLSFCVEVLLYTIGAALYWKSVRRADIRIPILLSLHLSLVMVATIYSYWIGFPETEQAIEIALPMFGLWLLIGLAALVEKRRVLA